MPVTICDVDAYLSTIAPRTLSESWDNDGVMLCRDIAKPVKHILVMLDVTDDGLRSAIDGGCDVIVTHHPLIFHPLAAITGKAYRTFETLTRADIAVLSYHTRLDAAAGGVNDAGAALLTLTDVHPFGGENGHLGRVGNLPTPLSHDAFIDRLKYAFHCPAVRASVCKDNEKLIRRVAFVGGAGKSFLEDACRAGADAFVTSELAHNSYADAADLGLLVYDCGHYYTENPVCARLKTLLDEQFGASVAVDVFDGGAPYADN